ncbi:class I SAM-dependent rRNA methyltransferase [Haloplasma contractile]|uniref:SAM-dependent methyltransferase ral function prediction only protein n=1 Tax=Haloplasma contractile SSD-17B TaxID=1033810 RepID=F7Q0E1_9MOLU|nr:class I SAM-dependent rRNA methyltransferase [Haloplasma contractile]ERJ12713.1 putative SAM-dependent methyltransferase ral function prediction only protein [Haloplasma contractile SSD-17B]
MKKKITVKVKSNFINQYKSGYPLISKKSIIDIKESTEEGTMIRLVDEINNFIAKGYFGKQNKGYGWVLSRNENESIDQQFFMNKLGAAINYRKSFFNSPHTNAFRVINGEGDGLGGLTIDYFNGYYLINWYSEGIYSFREHIINGLKELVPFKAIYQKKRFAIKGKYIEEDDFVAGERGTFPIIVKENGVNFAIYLNEGAMVGVFLDQREVRRKIRDVYAKGKTVLNTFSYTGAFSVFAAKGHAVKTTSVDLANRSLDKTIEQFSINDIDYESQDIIVMDVFKYFKYAVKKGLTFDMVILDPPSFARSKKNVFSAAKDYTNLLKEAIAITEDEGIIVASTNASSFNMKKFKRFINQAFKESNRNYQLVDEFSLPRDYKTKKEYPEGSYLKVVFIKKLS